MKLENRITKTVNLIYLIVFSFILLLLLFFFRQKYYIPDSYPNPVLMPLGILLLLLLYLFIYVLIRSAGKTDVLRFRCAELAVVFFAGLGFMRFQNYIISQYYFYTGWDVQTICRSAILMANGVMCDGEGYYSIYPNNVMVTYFLYRIALYARYYLGEAAVYPLILRSLSFICMMAGFALYSTVKKVTDNSVTAIWSYLVYLLTAGLSPWFSIPYTDSISMIFPILVYRLYLTEPKGWKSLFKWILIGFVTYIGYCFKPQTAVLTIAVVLIELASLGGELLQKNGIRNISKGIRCITVVAFMLGIFAGIGFQTFARQDMPLHFTEGKGVSWQHYFAMGMNPEYMGGFAGEDLEFAKSFESSRERNQAEFDLAMNRIAGMGPGGFALQMVRKLLSNYNDGTFFWNKEGDFYLEIPEHNTEFPNTFQEIYYSNNDFTGKYYLSWKYFEHSLWLGILFWGWLYSAVMLAVSRRKKTGQECVLKDEHRAYKVCVAFLSVLGLTLFELIFESRSRYLFCYIPMYIMIASFGIEFFCFSMAERIRKKV